MGLSQIGDRLTPTFHCNIWSTVFLDPGPLSGTNYRAFSLCLGMTDKSGRRLDIEDTNVREAGRLGSGAKISSMATKVSSCSPAGDIEQLAQAFEEPDDSVISRIEEHGTLGLDFTQTLVDVGPLWVRNFSVHADIPQYASFAVLLKFGKNAPVLTSSYAVRIFLSGMYDKSSY